MAILLIVAIIGAVFAIAGWLLRAALRLAVWAIGAAFWLVLIVLAIFALAAMG